MDLTSFNQAFNCDKAHCTPMTRDHFTEFKLMRSDPSIMQYVGEVEQSNVLNEKFIERTQAWTGQEGVWLTFLLYSPDNKDFLGSLGVRIDSKESKRVEIGYICMPDFAGNGVITSAAKSLIDRLFNAGVHKIVAHCVPENVGSWRVMEKLGMQREAELKDDFHIGGHWYDSYGYGLITPKKG